MTRYRYCVWSFADERDIETYSLDCESFVQFKTRFLKRFGNHSGKNKAKKDRWKVKLIVYKAPTIEIMVKEINDKTNWNIKLMEKKDLGGD